MLAYAFSVPRVCRECLAVPIGQWFVHIFKIIGLAAGTYALAWLVVCHGEPLTLSYSMSAYLLATVAFALAAFAVMGPELRASFRQVLGMLGLRTAAVTQKQGRSVPS